MLPSDGNGTPTLKRVQNLQITFLVDNCIEWMTKFPPGFSSELSVHLKQNPPVDPLTGVPFVDLENFCCGAHGFSALIETQIKGDAKHTVLFDTGPDSKSIIRNIEALQVQTHQIERVIISHWHSDHTGGLLSFLRHRRAHAERIQDGAEATTTLPVLIDVHPNRPIARGIAPPPKHDKVIARLPDDPGFNAISAAGGALDPHAEGHTVANGAVYVSGEIPRVTSFETGLPGGMRWFESKTGVGSWADEPEIMDERYAAVDIIGKGIVVFSACSHAGIVNVVKDVVKTFQRPIYMVVGGLHLAGPELHERVAPTVDFLARELRPSPMYVLPMHCTGFTAKVALEEALGDGCVPAGVGVVVKVDESAEGEQMVSRSVTIHN